MRRKVFEPVLGEDRPTPDNLMYLAANIEEQAQFVEKMEECFVNRLAARSEWDPTEPVSA